MASTLTYIVKKLVKKRYSMQYGIQDNKVFFKAKSLSSDYQRE